MIQKILFAAMFSGAAFAAQAQSAGFSITGTVAPSACTISLGGGGVNDFGSLSRESLTSATTTGHYVSPRRYMPVTVFCPAPTKFALAFTDNRGGTALDTSEVPADRHFGLGMHKGQKIGNAKFHTERLKVKTTAGGMFRTPAARLITAGVAGSTSAWEKTTTPLFHKNKSMAFVASADVINPDALAEVSGDVEVALNINSSLVDTATSEIQLDGSGTVTLILL
jgi:type 1 fimbria pilin